MKKTNALNQTRLMPVAHQAYQSLLARLIMRDIEAESAQKHHRKIKKVHAGNQA